MSPALVGLELSEVSVECGRKFSAKLAQTGPVTLKLRSHRVPVVFLLLSLTSQSPRGLQQRGGEAMGVGFGWGLRALKPQDCRSQTASATLPPDLSKYAENPKPIQLLSCGMNRSPGACKDQPKAFIW